MQMQNTSESFLTWVLHIKDSQKKYNVIFHITLGLLKLSPPEPEIITIF